MSIAIDHVGYWPVDAIEYHKDCTAQSHSMIERFRKSPLEYHAKYIARTLFDDPGEWADVGIALHTLLLEPEKFDSVVAIAPECDRRTKVGKAEYAEFLNAKSGRVVITKEQNDQVTEMVKSALAHPQVAALLRRPHKREQGVRWVDSDTGMACKCRPDVLVEFNLIADVKSALDPTPDSWERSVASYGYHRQQAHYCDGINAAFGIVPKFLHIVIGKNPPHETCCYHLDADAVELGRRQNKYALHRLVTCLESDDFREPRNKEIQICSLPRWAFQVQ